MTILEYLEVQRDVAYHNLLCYSRNYGMTAPKEGYKTEWQNSKEECRIVEELIVTAKGNPAPEIPGAAVIDGKVVHNWQEVLGAAKKVAGV